MNESEFSYSIKNEKEIIEYHNNMIMEPREWVITKIYIIIFLNNDLPNPFDYSGPFNYHVTNGSTQTLTITNINGDQAMVIMCYLPKTI